MGLGNGPSVQGLEDLYGRRNVIIDEIRRRQPDGINTGAAVEGVELIRQRGGLSLYQLYKLLK